LWPAHARKAPKAVRRSGHRARWNQTGAHPSCVTCDGKEIPLTPVCPALLPTRHNPVGPLWPQSVQRGHGRSLRAPADDSHGARCAALLYRSQKFFRLPRNFRRKFELDWQCPPDNDKIKAGVGVRGSGGIQRIETKRAFDASIDKGPRRAKRDGDLVEL
jgi:hypothetical protein